METLLKAGDQAPLFETIDQGGAPIALKDYKGQKVALYFYPKDNTPTCTAQACNLRDHFGSLKDKGIVVLGISPDNEQSHAKFKEKWDLPFTLLVDKDHTIAERYGVWGLKKFMGREYMGIKRTTFLINEQGRIHAIIEKVNSKDHARQIAEAWGY